MTGQDRQDEDVNQAYAHYGQHLSPLHETIYPFKSGDKNVFILSKQMENIDILITEKTDTT